MSPTKCCMLDRYWSKICSLVNQGRFLQASVSAERTEVLMGEVSNEIKFIFFPFIKSRQKQLKLQLNKPSDFQIVFFPRSIWKMHQIFFFLCKKWKGLSCIQRIKVTLKKYSPIFKGRMWKEQNYMGMHCLKLNHIPSK